MTRLNINSQIVQVLGFMGLGRTPKTLNGIDRSPRKGIGTRICCQQPLQMIDRCPVMRVPA
jgi:hypothetical protein